MDLTSPRSQTPDPPRGALRKPSADAPPAYTPAEVDAGVESAQSAAQAVALTYKPRTATYARSPRDTHPVPVVPTSPYASNRQGQPETAASGPGNDGSGVFAGRVISVHPAAPQLHPHPHHAHPVSRPSKSASPPVSPRHVHTVAESWQPEPYQTNEHGGGGGHFLAPSLRSLPYARTQPPGAETDENATHHRQDKDRPKHDSPRAALSPRRSLFGSAQPPPAYATQPPTHEPAATAAVRSSTVPSGQRVLTVGPSQQLPASAAAPDARFHGERDALVRHNQQLREQVVQAHSELRRAETQIAEMAGELARLRGYHQLQHQQQQQRTATSPVAGGGHSPAAGIHSPPFGGGIQPPLRFITNSPPFSPEGAPRVVAAPAEEFRDYRVPRKDTSPPAAPHLGEARQGREHHVPPSPSPSPHAQAQAPAQAQFSSRHPSPPRPVDHDLAYLRNEAQEYQRQLESARNELRVKDGIIDTLELENRTIAGSPERSYAPERTTFTSPRNASLSAALTRDRLSQLVPPRPDSPPHSVASEVMHQYLDEQTAMVSDSGMSPGASPTAGRRRTQYHSEDSEVPLAQKRWKWVTTQGAGAGGIKDTYPAQYQTRKQRQLVRQIIAGCM